MINVLMGVMKSIVCHVIIVVIITDLYMLYGAVYAYYI